MIQINSQPVPTRTIAPSSESSDNSGHEEYYPDGGRQNHERFEQKKPTPLFLEELSPLSHGKLTPI